MDTHQIRHEIERAAVMAGTQKELARKWRISPQYLSDVLAGRRKPGPKILRRLGLRVDYAPIEQAKP